MNMIGGTQTHLQPHSVPSISLVEKYSYRLFHYLFLLYFSVLCIFYAAASAYNQVLSKIVYRRGPSKKKISHPLLLKVLKRKQNAVGIWKLMIFFFYKYIFYLFTSWSPVISNTPRDKDQLQSRLFVRYSIKNVNISNTMDSDNIDMM